ncbi:MAG: 50S ribosomal protein L29 [Oscillospiraceae bacterium]|jgi:large subunit ribosomal protein L29|nr:50S ribosomal protein L29 [Oscillospiraceae bacterium]
MKINELRDLSPGELDTKLHDLKKDLFNLRMQHATNQLDNPIRISDVKRDIARVKTLIRENELKEAAGR